MSINNSSGKKCFAVKGSKEIWHETQGSNGANDRIFFEDVRK